MVSLISGLSLLAPLSSLGAGSLSLAWDASNDASVAGYKVHYGTTSQIYTTTVDVGPNTSTTISNLVENVSYYFAATAYGSAGIDSGYSSEITYAVRSAVANNPPKINAISAVTLKENAGQKVVSLSGISSGSTSEIQTLAIEATSDNTSVVPNPTVTYSSPNATGSLAFTPVPSAFGTANITVLVDDGGAVSNTTIRTFAVNVTAVNDPPTLDPISSRTLELNAGAQTVPLTGISAGPTNESQTLTVTAASSNTGLIPTPSIAYSSPNPTGTLTFTPSQNVSGTANITVTVKDGQTSNSSTTRVFAVTVNPGIALVTNAVIAPESTFRWAALTNGHKVTFALDAASPANAVINSSNGVVSWTPTRTHAGSTNIMTVTMTDKDVPSASTVQKLQVTVLDYIDLSLGTTNLYAGASATIPIYLTCNAGVTNLNFSISNWNTNRFANPALFVAVGGVAASSVVVQNTNLNINLRMNPGQTLTGSNLLGQLSFQTLATQRSGFAPLCVGNIAGIRANKMLYTCAFSGPGEVVIVKDEPLLRGKNAGTRSLTLYGKTNVTYQLQSSTGIKSAWNPVTTISQTNIAQTINVDPSLPVVFYRLLQK